MCAGFSAWVLRNRSDYGSDKDDDDIGAGVDGRADGGYIEDDNGCSYVTHVVSSVQS